MEEWAVCVIQGIYTDVKSCVCVNGQYKEFGVGVGVHQGSVLSPLLFILVLEALSRQFRTGVPWELLYADDLTVMRGWTGGWGYGDRGCGIRGRGCGIGGRGGGKRE